MDRPTIVVGVITKAHGIRGHVRVQNRSDNPDRWRVDAVVFDRDGAEYRVADVRSQGSQLVVRFDGVDDRSAADALRGRELLVPESWLPELPNGAWWPHQIEGCRIVTESGRDLGVVMRVIPNPANDLWVATDSAGIETMVPAIADLILNVDVSARRIVARDVPGLTVPEGEQGR